MRALDNYHKVVVVGDIQGMGSELEKLISTLSPETGLSDENICWIFAGDLFDRGQNPEKVFDILEPALGTLPNVHLVMATTNAPSCTLLGACAATVTPAKPWMRSPPTACTTAEWSLCSTPL